MFEDAYKYILKNIERALESIDPKLIDHAVDMLSSTNQVFVYGSGRSGLVGKFFAMRLVQLGIVAYFIGETITPVVNKDDVVVLISNTGKTQSTLLVGSIVKRVGAKIMAVTSSPNSPLSKHADLTFIIGCKKDRGDLAPLGTLFEDASVVFLDSLVSSLMKKLNQSEEDMRRRHAIWV
jgi:6-phospho-3-hexuloisomerase